MNPIVDEIARKFRDSLQASIHDFEGLYVFGSQVRGDATSESDLDIVVIFSQRRFYQPDEYYEVLSKMRYEYYDVVDYASIHRV